MSDSDKYPGLIQYGIKKIIVLAPGLSLITSLALIGFVFSKSKG
jgi:hypothetical protein